MRRLFELPALPALAVSVLGVFAALAPDSALAGEPPDRVLTPPDGYHKHGISALSVSPDGRKLISGGWDRSLILWDITQDEPTGQALQGAVQSIRRIVFAPDSQTAFATGDSGLISRWDMVSGQQIGTPWSAHLAVAHDLELIGAGSVLVSAARDGSVLLLDAETGQQTIRHIVVPRAAELAKKVPPPRTGGDPRFRAGELATMKHWIRDVAIAPDGSTAVIVGNDRLLRVWDIAAGRPLFEPVPAHNESISAVSLSANGRFAVTGSVDRTLQVWRVVDGQKVGAPLKGHTDAIYALVTHPEDLQVLAVDMAGEALLWDITTSTVLRRLDVAGDGAAYSVAFSPDGCTAYAAGKNPEISVWDLCQD